MSLFLKIIIFLLMAIVTAVVTYLFLSPSYLLQISVDPHSVKGLEIRRDRSIIISDGKEPIFFDIAGDVHNPNISKVGLWLLPPYKGEWEKRGEFNVANGSFLGRVKLGSAETPITSDENYPYTINSIEDNSRLSEGSIQVQVKAVISYTRQGWMAIIAGIGALASVLQFIQFLSQKRTL